MLLSERQLGRVFRRELGDSAGAEGETPLNSGTLPDGAAWQSWSFTLQGASLV